MGQELNRQAMHAQYGGRRYGGISPSRSSPIVMLFTDHSKGRQHGYSDGWGADGLYHYTGEGQQGDQEMVQGNKTILNHVADGRALHLFEGIRTGVVAYRGEFELETEDPWYRIEARDTLGEPRTVIMFRLRPLLVSSSRLPKLEHTPIAKTVVRDVDVEQHHTERSEVTSRSNPTVAERREAFLVANYEAHLRARGHAVIRKEITPAGERNALYTDLFDATANVLVEAKANATREAIRMAIGQLFDYQRFLNPTPSLAILVPTQPRKDLQDLCAALAIQTIWPSSSGYQASEPPRAAWEHRA
ncbi:restriction endonuclease [Streptomyces sp. A3M-1-3]|uniref:restriction endonuclease n=1 Tax=Streptomyces sp. A3M-1-3 TaxID=2962044 RepID=UPI0020B6FCB0|nr:restriction endonuclease [Streptomyces sp. A3M-1-3]MCP3819496.1 restriction endonuclease [Streptomyces sp. A3M-1-3]